MALTADLLARTRRHLMTSKQDRINVLGADMAAGTTSCVLALEIQGVNNGTILAVDLEEFFVTGVSGSAAGSTVNLIPGWEGSTEAVHAALTPVRLNPQFSDWKILQAINDSLTDLAGLGAFYVKPLEFDYSSPVVGYNIDADDFIEAYNVTYDQPGPAREWVPLRRNEYYVDPHPNAADFPGGVQLVLRTGGHPGRKVRLSYKARFGTLASLSDNVQAVTGLHDQGIKTVCLGAAIDLLGGREVKRSFLHSQPEPRRQEEVPPGHANQSMEALVRMYSTALDTYLMYLHRVYRRKVY